MGDRILIVDDEIEIADLIEVYLNSENYTVFKFYSAKEALTCINTTELDLAILDIMLPDIDGFTLCQKIRSKYTYPIIMLTAKDEETDKITGLTLGADDYITKPFRPLELIARVKSQLRRYKKYNPAHSENDEKDILTHSNLVMNVKTYSQKTPHNFCLKFCIFPFFTILQFYIQLPILSLYILVYSKCHLIFPVNDEYEQ